VKTWFQPSLCLANVNLCRYISNDVLSVQKSVVNHVEYTLGRSRYRFDDFEAYQVRGCGCLALH
jgi:hypothetical protein